MKEHFLIDPSYKNLNHGSFGTYPQPIQTALRHFQTLAEARTDPYLRNTQPRLLASSRAAIASLLNVPANTCVLVKNATTGVNTVLHNLPLGPTDAIVYFDTVYGAVEKALVWLAETRGVQLRKVEYVLPLRPEELVRRFTQTVQNARREGLTVKVGVFDTIVSNPGVRFPFEELVEACREEGVWSLVDAAHGVGQIELDLGKLRPDFLTSNCHKWLYVPRGCAVLYVPIHNQHLIRTTLPTSWGFIPLPTSTATAASTMKIADPRTAFEQLFDFVATTDDAAYLCIPAAIKFRQEVCGGEQRIQAYLVQLANEGADAVAALLGTEVMQEPGLKAGEKSRLRDCALATVRLPVSVVGEGEGEEENVQTPDAIRVSPQQAALAAQWFQTQLMDEHDTFVPVFRHGASLWTRLSAQVYLEKGDFEWLGGVLRELCGKLEREQEEILRC
ncbi:hypothetical protein FE257_005538 [Aspergillus nanangensis]|uniref:Aminotransferase class V domain-containing protein n=1 Tax=Aspergillus nanangensis TaxID=2582783 RepID=A0AAD4CS22_ASPNN|nr:hypothetical protein FE257_005538 [Aspergillus nanangensis]